MQWILTTGIQLNRLGRGVDISRGGLAFQYIADAGLSNGLHKLGIFLAGNGFRLEGIQFRIVSDVDVSEPHSLGYVPLRRCGVQFEHLDPDQASHLKFSPCRKNIPARSHQLPNLFETAAVPSMTAPTLRSARVLDPLNP